MHGENLKLNVHEFEFYHSVSQAFNAIIAIALCLMMHLNIFNVVSIVLISIQHQKWEGGIFEDAMSEIVTAYCRYAFKSPVCPPQAMNMEPPLNMDCTRK